MEAHIVQRTVIQTSLVGLHFGLDATDTPAGALRAPVSVVTPGHAPTLHYRVAATAELDVVGGRVIPEQTLVGLHS